MIPNSVYLKSGPPGLGDKVLLSAVVEELARRKPHLRIGVADSKTIFKNNPHIDPEVTKEEAEKVIAANPGYLCERPWRVSVPFVNGFRNSVLRAVGEKLDNKVADPRIYFSEEEASKRPVPEKYWVMAAGGKKARMTTKWYPTDYYQAIADGIARMGMKVVQVGSAKGFHPRLRGVVDLVGKTSLRELFSVIHNAEGVVCPITSFLHIARAVGNVPTICIIGGREDPAFPTYPNTKTLHTVGDLDCCRDSGCWANNCSGKSLGRIKCDNGVERDGVVYAACMTLIRPELVLQNVEQITACQSVSVIVPRPRKNTQSPKMREVPVAGIRKIMQGNTYEPRRSIIVGGISRSGNHPILDWIVAQCAGGTVFRNDVSHLPATASFEMFKKTNLLSSIDRAADVENFVYSMENKLPGKVKHLNFINSNNLRRVLILRDPFNHLASSESRCKKAGRKWPVFANAVGLNEDPSTSDNLHKYAALWLKYAKACLRASDDTVVILYNNWATSKEYRDSVFNRLGLDSRTDQSMGTVPEYGGGSSFDGRSVSPESMAVLDRWKVYADKPWFKNFFINNPEVVEMSEQIFGPIEGVDNLLV